jgi:nitrite reductase/ring-hydroxylating ferredoxin subunit
MVNYQKIANVSDLKPGNAMTVELNGEAIALYNIDGDYYATANTCPHKGGPLGDGSIEQDVVVCPWHGWKFNVKTGISPVASTVKIKTYSVKVEGEDILIEVD